jgi:hypothetical protein
MANGEWRLMKLKTLWSRPPRPPGKPLPIDEWRMANGD